MTWITAAIDKLHGGTDGDKPIYPCWLLHLVGDMHVQRRMSKRHSTPRMNVGSHDSKSNTPVGYSTGPWSITAKSRSALDEPTPVCIDLHADTTTQAPDRDDTVNVGGFSDAVLRVVSAFFTGDAGRL